MSLVSPCAHPGCRDTDGNPILTTETMCEPCRRHYRRTLDRVVLDYAQLKSTLPTPARRNGASRPTHKTYGHPAEWASVQAAHIADVLNEIEDGLRDDQHHEPAPHPYVSETVKVRHAHRYLTLHFEALCTYPAAADTAIELEDLHKRIRGGLGYTRMVELLPTPCIHCSTRALIRNVDNIECRECGHTIKPDHYGILTRHIIDGLIADYDTRERELQESVAGGNIMPTDKLSRLNPQA